MMRAWQYMGPGKLLEPASVQSPVPKPDEVIVRIGAAGVCHSDLHFLDEGWPMPVPMTMGHEGAGIVTAVGSLVSGVREGDRVAVLGANVCGTCDRCLMGRGNICERKEQLGLTVDGMFADEVAVRSGSVVPLPDGVDDPAGAVATDAVLTPYHAMRTVAGLRAGERIAIIGCGGLGLNGVQTGRALGCEVLAVDRAEGKRELAARFGAHETAEQLAKAPVLDAVIDFVGTEETIGVSQQAVRAGGRVVLVGLAATRAGLTAWRFGSQEIAVLGAFWGTPDELRDCLDLVASGAIMPQVETAPMSSVNLQLDRLRSGDIPGRVALLPD